MTNYRVNAIYPAFMGECNPWGIGEPCTFIRLAGCNLNCYRGCDTPEAMKPSCCKEMSADEIVMNLIGIPYKIVCVTGGEPLLQDCTELFTALSKADYNIVVETNGSVNLLKYNNLRTYISPNLILFDTLSFIVDVKSPSTGMSNKMLEENYGYLGYGDYIKFVVDDDKDLDFLREFVYSHPLLTSPTISVGLKWGSKLSYRELMGEIHHLSKEVGLHITLNMQTHKMACLYDKYRQDVNDVFVPVKL